jgi:hypothetical protein
MSDRDRVIPNRTDPPEGHLQQPVYLDREASPPAIFDMPEESA